MGNFLKGLMRRALVTSATDAKRTPAEMGSLASLRSKIKSTPIGGYNKNETPALDLNTSGFIRGSKLPGTSEETRAARAARILRLKDR